MALRSLVVMLKALPRRMPGFGAFALKGNPWSKSSAELTDPTKYGSTEESLAAKRYQQFYQRMMRSQEEEWKEIMAVYRNVALGGIVSLGAMGYVASTYDVLAKDYNQGGEQQKLI